MDGLIPKALRCGMAKPYQMSSDFDTAVEGLFTLGTIWLAGRIYEEAGKASVKAWQENNSAGVFFSALVQAAALYGAQKQVRKLRRLLRLPAQPPSLQKRNTCNPFLLPEYPAYPQYSQSQI